jgi:alpha-tubulin suppressor-like RCC1 family protein
VELKADGTVTAVGLNDSGQCDVSGWTDIIQIAAGYDHTVGLKADGTVVATGYNHYGQCDIGGWTDIVQVTAGYGHTVGLKADGTVVATGLNDSSQCKVGNWMDIIQVAAGSDHTVGLKSDGTVVAAGTEIELAKWNLGVVEYTLTISSTSGGSVTTPDKGMFTYNAGVMVRLVAEPEEGYRFVNWTGGVDTIANVRAATTIITMNGDYSITANFEEIPPVNWPLIGGIIAATVVAVGLGIFFVRRREIAQTNRQGRKRVAWKKRR